METNTQVCFYGTTTKTETSNNFSTNKTMLYFRIVS